MILTDSISSSVEDSSMYFSKLAYFFSIQYYAVVNLCRESLEKNNHYLNKRAQHFLLGSNQNNTLV